MLPLVFDDDGKARFKLISSRSLITYTIWIIIPFIGAGCVMTPYLSESHLDIEPNNLTDNSYDSFDLFYGLDQASFITTWNMRSVSNRVYMVCSWIPPFTNPGLTANLMAISETSMKAKRLTKMKTTLVLSLAYLLLITSMNSNVATKFAKTPQIVFLALTNGILFLYGMFTLLVKNIVMADFITASSNLDVVHNTEGLINRSRDLVLRFRKLKVGMSPILFIDCICFTYVLVSNAYFMILSITTSDYTAALFYGLFALYNLVALKFYTDLCGTCFDELKRNLDRLRYIYGTIKKITTSMSNDFLIYF